MMAGGAEACVPFLWPLEMANVLVLAERRRQITPARATALLEEIQKWAIQLDAAGVHRAFHQILTAAREHDLTSYDAAYLELALHEGLPLATLDKDLRRAARALGVAIAGTSAG